MAPRPDDGPHRRRSIRLKGHDYAGGGVYFVTIVTQGRACLFGDVVEGAVRLNRYGESVREEWEGSAQIRPEIRLDAYVIMPNHVHGIVVINADGSPAASDGARAGAGADGVVAHGVGRHVGAHHVGEHAVGAHGRAPLRGLARPPRSLGSFVAGFKSAAAKRINQMRGTPGAAVWQRNFYEHVIRNDEDLNRLRQYIQDNPLRWAEDSENPHRLPAGAFLGEGGKA